MENVRANKDQINNGSWAVVDGNWYLMPRMKIDINVFLYNRYAVVCTLKVVKYLRNSVPVYYPDIQILAQDFNQDVQGYSYDGTYVESYPTILSSLKISPSFFESNSTVGIIDSLDFKIKWPGNCDLWVDRFRVENQIAYDLFGDNGPLDSRHREFHDNWLPWEVNLIANQKADKIHNFYFDEFISCQIPCLKYINHKIDSLSPENHFSLVPALLYGGINTYPNHPDSKGIDVYHIHPNKRWDMTAQEIKEIYFDDMELKEMLFDNYPFDYNAYNDEYPLMNPRKLPNTLPIGNFTYSESLGLLGYSTNQEDYEICMNALLNKLSPYDFIGNYKLYNNVIKLCKSEGKDIPMVSVLQAHLNNARDGKLREPTNEELRVTSYIALSYGAKSIYYFAYMGYGGLNYYYDGEYCRGLINPTSTPVPPCLLKEDVAPRLYNVYGQKKWDSMAVLIPKIKHIGEMMLDFNPIYTYSYAYRIDADRVELNNTYFTDVITYKPNISNPSSPSIQPEATQNRHLQVGMFKKDNDGYSKYFMIINRRCSPFYSKGGDFGGGRYISVQFDANANELNGFNNWKIINMDDNSTVCTFDKQYSQEINLDWFLPGEGKLYKLAPVMQEGGEFVCDEVFSNLTVNCKGNVNTNGHYLLIGGITTVDFNADCGILAEDSKYFDVLGTDIDGVKFQGKNGAKWNGIYMNNVEFVTIGLASIKNVKGMWALNLNNCPNVLICSNTFLLNDAVNNQNLGALVINNNNSNYSDVELQYNNITVKNCIAAIALINSASAYGYVNIEGSNIICEGNGGMGLLLINYVQAILQTNPLISGFNESVHSYCSNVNLFENTLTSNKDNSIGISGYAWTEFNLADFNGRPLSGYNNITNQGNNCTNVKLDRSAFNVYKGMNNLNVNPGSGSYNFYGTVFNSSFGLLIDLDQNCFNMNNGDAIHYLTDTIGSYVYQVYQGTHNCNISPDKQIDFIVDKYNHKDTIYKSTDTAHFYFTYPDYLYGYIIRNLIKENYDSVIIQCTDILNNYPNYGKSFDLIPKLYSANLATDSTEEKILQLKNYFEQLILSNPQNVNLVQITNYFIQKCKVSLEQYQSALAGFEDIILQNPYNQIGVLASWDYAATFVLMDTLPGSGGYNELLESSYNYEYLIDSLRIKKLQKYDNYDKSVFTSEERKELFKRTGNVLIDERNKQIQKINDLQNELNNTKSDIKKIKQVKKDLEEFKIINELVKVKKPKSQTDYVNIVSQDISKMVKGSSNDNNKEIVSVPTTYSLSQNYPNPFNPVTKINYELPKDGKVKLVIYDILGREIKSLVNNEFKTAGRYTVEFDGTQYASGVYFFRIQVNGGTSAVAEGKGFTAVKKMVLVK